MADVLYWWFSSEFHCRQNWTWTWTRQQLMCDIECCNLSCFNSKGQYEDIKKTREWNMFNFDLLYFIINVFLIASILEIVLVQNSQKNWLLFELCILFRLWVLVYARGANCVWKKVNWTNFLLQMVGWSIAKYALWRYSFDNEYNHICRVKSVLEKYFCLFTTFFVLSIY